MPEGKSPEELQGATPQEMLRRLDKSWLWTCVLLSLVVHGAFMIGTSFSNMLGLQEEPEEYVNLEVEMAKLSQEAKEAEARTRKEDQKALEDADRQAAVEDATGQNKVTDVDAVRRKLQASDDTAEKERQELERRLGTKE